MSQFSDHHQVAEFGFVSVIAMYDMIKIKKVKVIK